MDRPYESIPRQGKHRGDAEGLESGMNVRAPGPPDLEQRSNKPPRRTHQVMHDAEKGLFRLRLWDTDEISEPSEGFRELGRYAAAEGLSGAREHLPNEPQYVVLENTRTGEVSFVGARVLSDNWAEEGAFDQFTLFDNEADAAAYADARQKANSGR